MIRRQASDLAQDNNGQALHCGFSNVKTGKKKIRPDMSLKIILDLAESHSR